MPTPAPQAEQFDVAVVGAGWNGLISAKTYLDFCPSARLVIIDDQATVGGVWSRARIYPTLFAQIKHGMFEYSFYPMRHEGITEDGYVSGETIHQYLVDFAHDFGLAARSRLSTTVTGVVQLPDRRWRLEIAGSAPIECEKLIYASGAVSHPVMPTWPTASSFTAPIIHSYDVGTHLDQLKAADVGTATVVGGAKSSYDTVFLLLKAGKRVHWIIRDSGGGPLAIMPPTLLGRFNTMDVLTMGITTMMGACVFNTDGPVLHFLQRTLLGRFLAWLYWYIVNWLADSHAGYSKSENARKLRPLPHGNGMFWGNAGVGAASVPHFWRTFHSGDCTVHRAGIASLGDGNTIQLDDGSAPFKTDYMILCTGFDKSYHVFDDATLRRCGLAVIMGPPKKEDIVMTRYNKRYELMFFRLINLAGLCAFQDTCYCVRQPNRHYRWLISPTLAAEGDRSVYFPGFIHSIYTPVVSETQALWGVAFLLGLLDLPSKPEMERDVATWNVWTRKRYVVQGPKNAYGIYDFISYINVLLKDLGVTVHHRRRNEGSWLSRLFAPTYPTLYTGMQEEFRQLVAEKQVKAKLSKVKS
ncbi:hypothetical protein MAPG_11354 [Magnaporthiopsis poae ATCC 64411]|uniref:Uncharacterized protein n=1 Tax=Magnaporthiopsis poae (strain ATCC 64411 / 73-15) TaxID=644358 RepID=A0A0C4EF19_MAGP6|nr:hypothetical protein MAPG_11354 [Magnaporthiopsis poae ATCC 64411]